MNDADGKEIPEKELLKMALDDLLSACEALYETGSDMAQSAGYLANCAVKLVRCAIADGNPLLIDYYEETGKYGD